MTKNSHAGRPDPLFGGDHEGHHCEYRPTPEDERPFEELGVSFLDHGLDPGRDHVKSTVHPLEFRVDGVEPAVGLNCELQEFSVKFRELRAAESI
jgi:hypothetical protein